MDHAAGGLLDPRDLATFVAAVECGTVGGAAQTLAITQSAATKRLQSLERRLEVALVERGRFGVRATDAGRLLYPEAKQALDALRNAASVVGEHAAGAPVLRLAASHTVGGYLLPGWLARFRTLQAGQIRAQVEIVNSLGVLAQVRDGHAEIGFIESLDPAGALDALTVRHDELVAVVAACHPWSQRRSIAAEALAQEPYMTREAGSGTRAVAAAALARAGIAAPAPTLESASTQSLKRAVAEGGGYTLISQLSVEAEVAAGTLCALPVTGADLRRPLRAVRRRRAAQHGLQRRLWAFLAREGGA